MRYLHQRYAMPWGEVTGILTDVGTEELAHLEMVAAILYQLTRNVPEETIADSPFATYFTDHTAGIYPIAASGVPFDMKYVGIKGDVIADLNEDLAADAAMMQEQTLSKKDAENPCKIRLFRTSAKRSKIATPLSRKSNNRYF